MKHLFDNEGVAQVEADLLALPTNERATQLQWMKDDFEGWMQSRFDLTSSQVLQLQDMPLSFKQELSHSVAACWASETLIGFHKEEKPEEEEDDRKGKEIIIFPKKTTAWNVENNTLDEYPGLDIWIRYQR